MKDKKDVSCATVRQKWKTCVIIYQTAQILPLTKPNRILILWGKYELVGSSWLISLKSQNYDPAEQQERDEA